jgi:hypothetical protein
MYRRKIAGLGMAFVLVLLALPLTSPHPQVLAQPTAPQAPGCWTTYKPLLSDPRFQSLKSVAGTSASDVWAVGYASTTGSVSGSEAIAAHWDGVEWLPVELPSPGPLTRLYDVATLSPIDAWAVGSVGEYGRKTVRTLTLHWDGSTWFHVPSPNAVNDTNDLLAVAAVSPDDVWAGGYFEDTVKCNGCRQALLLHWDGREWTRVESPALPVKENVSGYNTIESFAVISNNDIWAVGESSEVGTGPLAIHWNGVEWKRAVFPRVQGVLQGVTALAHDDVWAVGDDRAGGTLMMHWDGTTWTVVPSPGVNGNNANYTGYWLAAAAARSANDVWAVGRSLLFGVTSQMYIIRWDGREWRPIASPVKELGTTSAILDDAAMIGGDLWLSGDQQNGMVLRHNRRPCPPPVPVPGEGSRTFPETGKTVSGVFLNYWEEHGGLMQQGYPISDPIGEVSDLDGKLYTVQYFERAVMEYHPQNIAEYRVLLAQLGAFRYHDKYPNGALNQRPSAAPDAMLFPETGKRLGGAFLVYWQSHGGVMQQGFPISDEFTEVSDVDGKPYVVQYFERAVFELHAENAGTPYEVLLSHLGSTLWREKYGTQDILTPLGR